MGLFTPYRNLSDEEVMRRWQDGKRAAMDEIYNRYARLLLHYMLRILNYDEALAQDLLHDLFMSLMERPQTYDPERPLRPYLYTMAANACRKHYRQLSLRPQQEVQAHDQITQHNSLDVLVGEDTKLRLKVALAELSYDHRAVFILRFQERFSVKQCAEILDCSAGTIKSRSHYCLQQLSKRLALQNMNAT